jgi:hypothetical protein
MELFLIVDPFRIIEFEFKGLIGKIFWKKDLGLWWPGGAPGAPLFLSIVLLYQFDPTYTDKFRHFIFLANSLTYGENRRNGGLTRFLKIG